MFIQKNLFSVLMFIGLISQTVKADTLFDGLWQMDPSRGVSCSNGQLVEQDKQAAFFKRYASIQWYLSDLSAVMYWITEQKENISVNFRIAEVESNNKYLVKSPHLTVPDMELSLSENRRELVQTASEYEFDLCPGGKYKVIFEYLRLNP